jgi:hypothetical protein
MADEKWVENAQRLLGLKAVYKDAAARWYALVRVFNQDVGVSLARAASMADEALTYPPDARLIVVGKTSIGNAGVAIDRALFESAFAASLSAAKEFGGARRRGRLSRSPRGKSAIIDRASEYGVDIGLVEAGLKLSVRERLQVADENAAFVNELKSRPATR